MNSSEPSATAPRSSGGSPANQRYAQFDVLRGLVIVLMALDHTRDFVQPMGANPTNWATTSGLFFLIRWVTHLCAPCFVFLMGVAASLRHRRAPEQTRRFLLQRGIWLIVLEATWISFCWSWDPLQTYLGVLWALGTAMILLAACVGLSHRVMAIGGAVGIVALELLAIQPEPGWLRILFQPGGLSLLGHPIAASYVVLPWFAVAALGWGLAPWLVRVSPRKLAMTGMVMLTGFGLYRLGGTTDPDPWTQQASAVLTAADFLNPSKYPPSLCFLLLTLGISALILAGPARGQGPISRVLGVYGRVPMFFYLVHLPLAHLVGNAWALGMFGTPQVPRTEPVSCLTIVVAWMLVVGLLWQSCRGWDELKRSRRDLWWLRYL